MSGLLDAALGYARRGIPVFPVDRESKAPLSAHGFKDATTDESQVRRWWQSYPDANVAVPTGRRIGLLAIDIDPRHGGDETLARLENGSPIPEGPVTITGSGGKHIWFKDDTRFTIGAGKGDLAGVDFRGEGGYVVAAPSVHASGKAYEGEVPSADSVPTIPEWLASAILTNKRAKIDTTVGGPKIVAGTMNDTLHAIGTKLRKQGWELDDILQHFILIARTRCDPPIDVEDPNEFAKIEGIAQRVAGYAKGVEVQEAEDALARFRAMKHPVHPPVDSRVPHGEIVPEISERGKDVHGPTTIFVPAVHPSDMPGAMATNVVSVGMEEDGRKGVDSRKPKFPTLVNRILRRSIGKNLREELGIEVYTYDANGNNPRPKPPADIAEQLLGLFNFACPWAEDQPTFLSVYDNGVYIPARKMLSRLLRVVLPPSASKAAYLTEIVTYLKDAESYDLSEFDDGEDGWLNTRTCWVNVVTRETRPHSPEQLSLKQLPIDYDPKATCPSIDALFRQWVDDDHVLVLYENIAQTLVTNDYPIQSVVVLIGNGQNGKSTYLRIVTAFLGKENVSSIELQAFGVNRFATNKLIGKMANICADMDRKRFTNTAEFKKLTGDDPIQAEIKHGALFSFFNYAKLMVSLNQLPPSPDDSDAFHRRIYRLRFDRKFSGKDRKRMRDLLKTAQAEMSGLLNKCLDVLPALLDRQHFHGDTEDIDSKREAYTRGANPIYGFFEDHLAFKAGDNGTVKDDLFMKFSAYAKSNDIPAMKLEAFFTDLKSEIVKRGYPYETHRVGPEKNRGPRLLKGIVYVERKTESEDLPTSDPSPTAAKSEAEKPKLTPSKYAPWPETFGGPLVSLLMKMEEALDAGTPVGKVTTTPEEIAVLKTPTFQKLTAVLAGKSPADQKVAFQAFKDGAR